MRAAASYSRPVKRTSLHARRSPGVYYILFLAVLPSLLALTLGGRPASAQVELTVHPSMVKGPPDAPVTIVEFSDYQ